MVRPAAGAGGQGVDSQIPTLCGGRQLLKPGNTQRNKKYVENFTFPQHKCDEGGLWRASVNTWVGEGILEVWRDGRARAPWGPFTQNSVNGGERGGGKGLMI